MPWKGSSVNTYRHGPSLSSWAGGASSRSQLVEFPRSLGRARPFLTTRQSTIPRLTLFLDTPTIITPQPSKQTQTRNGRWKGYVRPVLKPTRRLALAKIDVFLRLTRSSVRKNWRKDRWQGWRRLYRKDAKVALCEGWSPGTCVRCDSRDGTEARRQQRWFARVGCVRAEFARG
jgi:hypothetical protein